MSIKDYFVNMSELKEISKSLDDIGNKYKELNSVSGDLISSHAMSIKINTLYEVFVKKNKLDAKWNKFLEDNGFRMHKKEAKND